MSSYATLVDLYAPFDRRVPGHQGDETLLDEIAAWLLGEEGGPPSELAPGQDDLRRLITDRLTRRPARPIPMRFQSLLDELWAREASGRAVVTLADVARAGGDACLVGATRLDVWRGDITTLHVDAIVNAANAELLGCFRPQHLCIDNAIHRVAGPRLRQDCGQIMVQQGHPEPTGAAKATRGYYLPARFVLHTVGPIVRGNAPSSDQRQDLTRCYDACLDLAAEMGLRSIAFCAISTGVYGYPKRDAAAVAVESVRAWLTQHPAALEAVVFDVFSEADEQAYNGLLRLQ